MEKLATDIYTFEKLVKNGFTYIDKTDRLWPLVNLSIGSQFFIARPRRFGTRTKGMRFSFLPDWCIRLRAVCLWPR